MCIMRRENLYILKNLYTAAKILTALKLIIKMEKQFCTNNIDDDQWWSQAYIL